LKRGYRVCGLFCVYWVRFSVVTAIPQRITAGMHSTDHPSSSAKTQTPLYLPARYITSNIDCRPRRLTQEWPLLAQPAGGWPN